MHQSIKTIAIMLHLCSQIIIYVTLSIDRNIVLRIININRSIIWNPL
jgi:hypothetical protein